MSSVFVMQNSDCSYRLHQLSYSLITFVHLLLFSVTTIINNNWWTWGFPALRAYILLPGVGKLIADHRVTRHYWPTFNTNIRCHMSIDYWGTSPCTGPITQWKSIHENVWLHGGSISFSKTKSNEKALNICKHWECLWWRQLGEGAYLDRASNALLVMYSTR